jgi:hypothetical protein
VGGHYVYGIELGDGGTTQTDTTDFYGLRTLGDWTPESGGNSVYGIYEHGSGNITEFKFFGLSCTGNETHVKVDTETIIIGANFSTADTDLEGRPVGSLMVRGVRSEGSLHFLDASGGASYPVNMSFRDIGWNGDLVDGTPNAYWAQIDVGGCINLSNILLRGFAVQPVIYAHPAKPLQLTIHGFAVGGSASLDLDNLFDLTTVDVQLSGYVEFAATMGIQNVILGHLTQSPDKTWWAIQVADDGTVSAEAV